MASNTIRAQAASAVLALMEDDIMYVQFRYPRNEANHTPYVAKVTKEQADEILQILENNQVAAAARLENTLTIKGFAPTAKTPEDKVYGVLLNESSNSTIPYQIVEIFDLKSYADLDVEVDPLRLRYLSAVISDVKMLEAQEREKKAVDLVTQRVIKNTKKSQALALLGEEGVAELSAQLGIKTVDSSANPQ